MKVSKTQDFSRRISEQAQEISNLKDQVRESHVHARNAHAEKQRLEKQIHDLRNKQKAATTPDGSKDTENEWPTRASAGQRSSGIQTRPYELESFHSSTYVQ